MSELLDHTDADVGTPTDDSLASSTAMRRDRALPQRRRRTDGRPGSLVGLTTAPPDRLEPFAPAILAIRWATTMVSIALAASAFIEPDWTVVPWVAAIITNTAIRTLSPIRYVTTRRTMVNIGVEISFHLVAVAATGFWRSPLIFSLIAAITVASFARGFQFGLRLAAASALAISLPELIQGDWAETELVLSAQWSTVLILVAIIAGYARHISWQATQQQELALDRLSRLADANTLLFNLNEVAQLLPSSLDSEEVLESTMQRLQGLVPFDHAVILTIEEADSSWVVVRKRAVKIDRHLQTNQLPAAARRSASLVAPVTVPRFAEAAGRFHPDSRSGIYIPLLARGSLIGLLALESRDEMAFDRADEDVLAAFVEPAALAIDNARLFAKLRTVGADEERTRIARDLHDRIGQSLAYLAFELDRILRREDASDVVQDMLQHLRDDLRSVVSEVRDTLYDLRTDVGSDKDFATTMVEFADRVSERSVLAIELQCDRADRLPILQEREMWRIAQEALINVERHADASHVTIRWTCDGSTAELSIADDGRGFPEGQAGRIDSYGILGMRERAASIGAALEVISHPGEGTKIRCSLAQG